MKSKQTKEQTDFEIYINGSLQTRYEIAKSHYYKMFPNGNLKEFHKIETTYLEKEKIKFEQNLSPKVGDIQLHFAQCELLEYLKGLSLEMDFKNNFDRVPESEVYQYFKTNLVDKKLLTEAEMIKYLKAAFEHKQKPKKQFKITGRTKGQIVKIFHEYYEKAGHPHGRAKDYAGLLGDYIEGFTTKGVSSNFSK